MSYILDALRKSEQQRLQGEAPLLLTTQTSFSVSKQPALFIYGLLAAILICAGVLIGWLRPWQQDKTEAVKDFATLSQQEVRPAQIAAMPQSTAQPISAEAEKVHKYEPVLPTQKPTSVTKFATKADMVEQVVPAPAKVEAPPLKSPDQKSAEHKTEEAAMPQTEKPMPPTPEPNSAIDTHSTTEEAAPQHKIMAMSELPQSIQQEIPAMSISGYATSSIAKERSVGINDRLLQEGEYLAPGLKLEQISEDGLIFSYKKYLFRHSL